MRSEAHEIPQRKSLWHLGFIISKDGEIKDIRHGIRARWLKWRLAFGVLYDQPMPLRFKENFYKRAIGPAMTYRAKCWPFKK